MRKILSGLIIAFLIVFLNLMTSFIALIIIKGSTPSSYQALDVAKQIDVSRETVRNVTAYNVGDPKQTHSRPCIGAGGDNLCSLVKRGVNVCAANFVPLKSKLYVDKFGECIVLDRMNARFGNRETGLTLRWKRANMVEQLSSECKDSMLYKLGCEKELRPKIIMVQY